MKKRLSLPVLYRKSTLFLLVMLSELLAIIITLLLYDKDFFNGIGLVSLYCHWCLLLTVLFYTGLSKITKYLSFGWSVFFVYLCCLLAYTMVEWVSQTGFLLLSSVHVFDFWRFTRYGVVAAIIALVAVRSVVLFAMSKERQRLESAAQMMALQARIKPHFLFNSLNIIAELTVTNPAKAEQAVENLASLFRVSLKDDERVHNLEEELSVCDQYLALERLRLGDRLHIEREVVVTDQQKYYLPKLIIQPLIENAVMHGACIDGKVHFRLQIYEKKQKLVVKLTNFFDESTKKQQQNNGVALKNIKQRLQLLYDDECRFKIIKGQSVFEVRIILPKTIKDKVS